MTRQNWEGHRARRGARAAMFGLAALAGCGLVGGMLAVPAAAQWIGSPGGGTVEVSPTTPSEGNMPGPAITPGNASLGGNGLGGASAPPGFSPSPGFSSPLAAPPQAEAPSGPPQGGPAQGDMADCQANVNKLRDDVEARGKALQAASKKKAPPDQVCPLFRNYSTAQQKFFTYLRTNKTKCGVPDEVLTKLKEGNAQVVTVRDRVCEMAAAGPGAGGGGAGRPPQGSVASGLGLQSGLPGVSASKPGGVFDTLGGSALR